MKLQSHRRDGDREKKYIYIYIYIYIYTLAQLNIKHVPISLRKRFPSSSRNVYVSYKHLDNARLGKCMVRSHLNVLRIPRRKVTITHRKRQLNENTIEWSNVKRRMRSHCTWKLDRVCVG